MIRLTPELLAQVDRVEHAHADLRGHRPVAQHVAHVQAPRDRDRDRQDLQAEKLVDPQEAGEALAAGEEQRRLLTADRNERDHRHVVVESQPDPALATIEVDLGRVPGGAVNLVVAARIHEQSRPRLERRARVLVRCRHGPVLA